MKRCSWRQEIWPILTLYSDVLPQSNFASGSQMYTTPFDLVLFCTGCLREEAGVVFRTTTLIWKEIFLLPRMFPVPGLGFTLQQSKTHLLFLRCLKRIRWCFVECTSISYCASLNRFQWDLLPGKSMPDCSLLKLWVDPVFVPWWTSVSQSVLTV